VPERSAIASDQKNSVIPTGAKRSGGTYSVASARRRGPSASLGMTITCRNVVGRRRESLQAPRTSSRMHTRISEQTLAPCDDTRGDLPKEPIRDFLRSVEGQQKQALREGTQQLVSTSAMPALLSHRARALTSH
jgi:hypothetical protein